MWLTAVVAVLFPVSLTLATVVDKEIQSIVESIFAPDLFHRFLQAYPPNASISPCDNFFRHICPVDLPTRHSLTTVLGRQSSILRSVQELNFHDDFDYTALMKFHKVVKEGMEKNSTPDEAEMFKQLRARCHGKYQCISGIAQRLLSALIAVINTYKNHSQQPILVKLEKLSGKISRTSEYSTTAQLKLTVEIMKFFYNPDIFTVDEANFTMSTANRLAFLSFVKRGGFMNEELAREAEAMDAAIREEIARDAMSYTWSRQENRFGVVTGELFALHMRKGLRVFLPMARQDLHDTQFEQFANDFLNNLRLADQIVGTPDEHVNRLVVIASIYNRSVLSEEELELTSTFNNFFAMSHAEHFMVFSYALVLRLMHNVPEAIKYGGLYAIYGHEAQHQLQILLGKYIENQEFYENRYHCLSMFMRDMCHTSMFKETRCNSGNDTFAEDDADLLGERVALNMYRRLHLHALKEKPYADLNLTNEQMFFVAQAIISCDDYESTQHTQYREDIWGGHSANYIRANAIFTTMNEFRKAFKCSSASKMVQQNPFFLERNSDGQYPEVTLEACDPETSGYNYARMSDRA